MIDILHISNFKAIKRGLINITKHNLIFFRINLIETHYTHNSSVKEFVLSYSSN